MSAQHGARVDPPTAHSPTLTQPPNPTTLVSISTREEAGEARRLAAERGDYVQAERWYHHERTLAAAEANARLIQVHSLTMSVGGAGREDYYQQ